MPFLARVKAFTHRSDTSVQRVPTAVVLDGRDVDRFGLGFVRSNSGLRRGSNIDPHPSSSRDRNGDRLRDGLDTRLDGLANLCGANGSRGSRLEEP